MIDSVSGQVLYEDAFRLEGEEPLPVLASNTITDVLIGGDNAVWLGTGAGLSRTRDEGFTFDSFTQMHGLGKGGISGMAVTEDIVWVATGFDTVTEFGSFQAGGGLAYSPDDGMTWTYVSQPDDQLGTNVNNITFDIALRGAEVWITSFAGSLRRSVDLGQTWQIVTPDSFVFDPANITLNHRAFSVISVDSTLWVGTAGGINRTTDGGETWTNFNHQNQSQSIAGNFVVALAHQRYGLRNVIWAATWETTSESNDTTEYRGISWSEDQGFSWRTALRGETAYNIAFDDSVVYVGTEKGLYKSIDGGENWALFPAIANLTGTRRILATEVFDAGVSAGTILWAGTGNGLAKSSSGGRSWDVFQVFPPAGKEGEPRTYAYPNPFSPNIHNRFGDAGHVRFQYNTTMETRVTIKLYDFSMRPVATVVDSKPRPAAGDFYEIWDGTGPYDEPVANGVYFYQVTLAGDGEYWGKLIVLR
jgi:photosystem II stability/assembly factor-like uncharacterized protein